MATSRRRFSQLLSMAAASLLMGSWTMCNKASDVISNLRGILQAVEKALAALSLLGGLLPDAVHTAARYLTVVCEFVVKVDDLLADQVTSANDKTRQILDWAGALVFPVIPPPIGPILQAVAAAVDKFLQMFGTDQAHARSAKVDNPPKLEFDDSQRAQLKAMSTDAEKDKEAVADWEKKAMGTPSK